MNIPYNEFDDQLKRISGLTWLPWIGKNYSVGSALILGESHYCYGDHTLDDIENDCNETRSVIGDFAMLGRNAGNQYKTYEPMETILKNTIVHNDCENVWQQIAYMNLVQRCMENNQDRPHWNNFLDGWFVVLQVINILRPGICVCFSTDKNLNRVNFNRLEEFKNKVDFEYSVKPNQDTSERISRCIVATPGEISIGEYRCKVVFTQHASRMKGNVLVQWDNVVKKYLED